MSIATPFAGLRTMVRDEHVDYNGHMGIRSYTRLFDEAVGPFYDFLGLSREAVAAHGATIFALQDTAWYRREVMLGDPLLVTAQLIDHDHNKLVSFFEMRQTREDYVAACFELIELWIDRGTRRAGRFPPAVARRLGEVRAAHDRLGRPALAGQGVAIRRQHGDASPPA